MLRGVTKRFGDLVAVDDIDLEVRPGEFLALLGPSGCGKTTTLRMIAGFDEPTEGEIEIGGRSAVGVPPNKRDVNTVFQQYALFPHMTVLDNVAYGLKQRKVGKEERHRQAAEALELVRLTGREHAKPAELSGGMQQRVALARALVMKPKVLLLDEPLGALDLKLRKAMQVELKRIQRDVGITFIVVTHDQEEAMAMADRIAVMNAGRIDQLAAPVGDLRPPLDPVRRRLHRRHEPPRGRRSSATATSSSAPSATRASASAASCARRTPASRVRIGLRPEEVHANTRGEGAPATCQTAMVLGHHLQIVAGSRRARRSSRCQRRAGDEHLDGLAAGDKVWLAWSPTAALLLGPADGAEPRARRRARRSTGLNHERKRHMPDRPDELHILVPESRRAEIQRMVTRRQALLAGGGAAMAAYLAGCGGHVGQQRQAAAAEAGAARSGRRSRPTPADGQVEQGDLLMANWVDYSDPANYKGYQKDVGPKVKVSGFGSNDEMLAKLRAGGSKYDVISPTGYAVKTMVDLGLIMPLTHELIPNMKNLSPAFTEDRLRPGQQVLGAEGLRHHELLLADRQGAPRSRQRSRSRFDLLKTPKFKDLRVNFLEGGTQVMALALAALGYSINSEDQKRDRRGQAAARRRQAERRHDQLDLHRARDPRRDRLRHGLERRHPPRDRRARRRRIARWSSSCPRARRSTGSTTGSSRPTPSTPSPRTSGSTTCSIPSPPARR